MVPLPQCSTYSGAIWPRGSRLWLSTTDMATTLVAMPMREVLRCDNCSLVQFRTSNSMCRRCHKALDPEEPIRGTVVVSTPVSAPANEDPGMRVAKVVKEIRRARHLSQRQLASRMQVPRTYISKIENGKAMPTLTSLERLAEALEVDLCHLVRDERSQREEEISTILSDSFLAEIVACLPQLEPLHRSMLLNHVRDLARDQAKAQARESARLQSSARRQTA